MTKKSFLAVFLAFTMIFSSSMPLYASGFGDITAIIGGQGGTSGVTSNTIYYGSYYQTWDEEKTGKKIEDATPTEKADKNNYKTEGIQWRVLKTTAAVSGGVVSGQLFLLSDKALYADQFDASTNVWENSTARATLNSRTQTLGKNDGFAGDAFSEAEWEQIAETDTETGIKDQLFFLSKTEAEDASGTYGLDTTTKRQSGATTFSQNVTMYDNPDLYGYGSTVYVYSNGKCVWWLRSPGDGTYDAFNVGDDGEVNVGNVDFSANAVRPAFNLNLESLLFLSAAVGGKQSAACGGGFGLENYDGTTFGWKLTIKDYYNATTNPDGIEKPTVTTSELTKDTAFNVNHLAAKALDVSKTSGSRVINIGGAAQASGAVNYVEYSENTARKNMFVSALLYSESTGTTKENYAKVASVGSEKTKKGVFAVLAPTGKTSGYLCFYAEQANGNMLTDYASEFNNVETITWAESSSGDVVKTLSKDYAASGLTADLFANAELGFEAGAYDTSVIIDPNQAGKITADATDGTTLTGDVTVSENATLTTTNKFTLAGGVTNDGTLEFDGGTLAKEVKSSAEGTYGTLDLQKATEIAADINRQKIKLSGSASDYSSVYNASYISNNDLTFNGGGLDLTKDATVASYTFNTLNLAKDGYLKLDADLASEKMDTIAATSVTGTATLHITALALLTDAKQDTTKVNFTNDTTLKSATQYNGAEEVSSLASKYKVSYDDTTGDFTFIKSGASNTTTAVSDTANVINFVWLETVNNVQKRLGDLRGGEASDMAWARFQRSNDDYKGSRQFNVSGNMYQVGYDFALHNQVASRGYFGVSLERFDGTQSYKLGGGDVASTSLGAYYTKIYDSGHYFDFILRYGRLESDSTSYDSSLLIPISTKLDYAMNSVTLSGEYGYRANLGKSGLYLEPQAEFIYGYLAGTQATSSTNYLADIDSTNHFVTRLGLAFGQRVKNFNYYLRGSYYHDFAGTIHVKYGGTPYQQDSAQNWWEVSLGGGWNISKVSYFYAELTKHFKDVSNSLNFNVGFRFTL